MADLHRVIPRDDVQSLVADLRLFYGSFALYGTPTAVLDARFQCDEEKCMPQIAFQSAQGHGHLHLAQIPRRYGAWYSIHSDWQIGLSQTLPTDLTVRMERGLGQLSTHHLHLSRFQLDSGDAKIGVNLTGRQPDLTTIRWQVQRGKLSGALYGDFPALTTCQMDINKSLVELDLDGAWQSDFSATFNVNRGIVILKLPVRFPVRINTYTNTGIVSADYLETTPQGYTNGVSATDLPTLELHIRVNSGQVHLQLGDL